MTTELDLNLSGQDPDQGGSDVFVVVDHSPIHFVGIGGAGMSGVARLWLAAGAVVSGSDARETPVTAALRHEGVSVAIGHRADQVATARTVVVSSAVRDDNPEVMQARGSGVSVIHRSQALAIISTGRRVVAIAGTNGKTTTSAMVTVFLRECGLDPSFSIGGDLLDVATNAHLGTGDAFVLEADESDGTFVVYRPQVAVVTNVQPDHLDFYGDAAGVQAGFVSFAQSLHPKGKLIACADDEGARQLAKTAAGQGIDVVTYGESVDADIRVCHLVQDVVGSTFDVQVRGEATGPARLEMPGRHNVLNALAAVSALDALGVPLPQAVSAIHTFRGTRRRFECRGEAAGIRVYDDYAHNPGKVAAVLQTGRQVVGTGRLVVAFQPHLYSRTRDFAAEFGAALGSADEVIVLDVYGAREDPLPGVSGELIARAVPLPTGRVTYVAARADAVEVVLDRLRATDVLLTVGAGDVTELAGDVLARLQGLP